MKPKVVIWGARGHALVVASIFKCAGTHDVVGFLDTVNELDANASVGDIPLFKNFRDLKKAIPDATHLTFGFGDCDARSRLVPEVYEQHFAFATAIHPSAVLSDVQVGEGSVIAPAAVVNCFSIIGRNVIVNTGATIDHECMIGEAAHICPGVHLAGNVFVGSKTWVGIGTTVIDKIKIGSGSIIGAGSLVLSDIPDGVVAYGSPAKVRRKI